MLNMWELFEKLNDTNIGTQHRTNRYDLNRLQFFICLNRGPSWGGEIWEGGK